MLSNIELKEVVEPRQKEGPKEPKETAQVVILRRGLTKEEFIIFPKKGFGGMVFNIYERMDDRLVKPIGELEKNPATGTFKGSVPVFK
jgi:hypothetical protein